MMNVMKKRVSNRQYLNEKIDDVQLDVINAWVQQMNQASNLTCTLVKDVQETYPNFDRHIGKFENINTFVMMKGSIEDEHVDEKIGYYGEELVLKLTELGLGTCWIGTYQDDIVKTPENEKMPILIYIGKIKDEPVNPKERKTALERITSDVETPEWILKGLEAVVLAPSARHRQSTHFTYEKGELKVEIANDHRMDMVDLGIAKKHFELVVDGHFERGNHATFSS